MKFGPATLVINYTYQYKDHLGNIRLNYGKDPETNVLRVLEENHYYPFGLKHQNYNTGRRQLGKKEEILAGNLTLMPAFVLPTEDKPMAYKYKYNGKEWQDELGLNMYALDWRQYDAAIGRFVSIDLFSEFIEQIDKSPYSFAWNNPVYFNDPSGLCPECDENVKNPTSGQSYLSTGGATYIYDNGQWTRQDGELDEVVVSPSSGGGNTDNGFIVTPKIVNPAPTTTTNVPKPSPTNPGKGGLIFIWWLFYTPDSSPYSPTNRHEVLNPTEALGKKRDETSMVRVQFQQGTSNIASQTALNTAQKGVTTLQADVALVATRQLAREQMKKVLNSPQAQNAFAKMAKKIQSAPASGGIIAGTRTTLQETFIYDNKTYRIDVESIKGHNLRQ